MRFELLPSSESANYRECGKNSQIYIEKNSLIYMEAKTSFPLKYEMKEKEKIIQGSKETKFLIQSIIRKSKKFYEIPHYQKKKIEKIYLK